jgi:predicted RNA-binding Zn-ribbon protein involved in translation (DUF1610 family)
METPDQPTPEKLEVVTNVKCTACGSEMIWSPEKQKLECKHCGNLQEMPFASDQVVERSFAEGLSLADQPTGYGTPTKVFNCKSCGSNTAVEASTVSFQCPFCGSDNVNEEAAQNKVIQPAGILPFVYDKRKALDAYKTWIKKGLFTPSSLKKIAALEKIAGVYLPFWTYDADTFSHWTAMAGYYYYTTETYYEGGQMKTRQKRNVRWVPASGYLEKSFDDVLVVASHGVTQREVEKIYPFTLSKVNNYDPRFILGHLSEVYERDVKGGYQVADGIMDAEIRSACTRQIPGDTHKDLSVSTRKSNITFKHILLPIWVAAYKFKGKSFQFLVNGETGKIAGKKPVSVGKVILAILIGLIIAGGLYFLFGRDK